MITLSCQEMAIASPLAVADLPPQAPPCARDGSSGSAPGAGAHEHAAERTPQEQDADQASTSSKQQSLSSLSSISSHPLRDSPTRSDAGSVANPFAPLDNALASRSLRHDDMPTPVPPQGTVLTSPPARRSPQHGGTAGAAGDSAGPFTVPGRQTNAGADDSPASMQDVEEQVVSRTRLSAAPRATCNLPLVDASRAAPVATVPFAEQAGADATRRLIRGSWIAGNLAQLDELQGELQRCSPGGSPTRRTMQHERSALALVDPQTRRSLPELPLQAGASGVAAGSAVECIERVPEGLPAVRVTAAQRLDCGLLMQPRAGSKAQEGTPDSTRAARAVRSSSCNKQTNLQACQAL
jgi:hypothetical protein